MKNEELIKVLRCEFYGDDECDTSDCPIWSELGCRNGIANRAAADALEAAEKRIAGLEAKVERLKASNEELREKQTYIDHWGDKWMTSGKDVPTIAYNHGFFDGEQACNCGAKMHNPCADCQEFDCYGCEYKKGEQE